MYVEIFKGFLFIWNFIVFIFGFNVIGSKFLRVFCVCLFFNVIVIVKFFINIISWRWVIYKVFKCFVKIFNKWVINYVS